MLPSDLLRLGVEVVVPANMLVEELLPPLRELDLDVPRLHLLDGVVEVEPKLIPLRVLVPHDHDPLLAVHPPRGLALQTSDLDPGAVGNLAFRKLLIVVLVPRLNGGVHEVVLPQSDHDGVVAAALEADLIPVNVRMVLQDSHNLTVVVWLGLDAKDLHEFVFFEDGLLVLGLGRLAAGGGEHVVPHVVLLLLAVLLDLPRLLRQGPGLDLSLQGVAHELVVVVGIPALHHELPPSFAFVLLLNEPLEDGRIGRLVDMLRGLFDMLDKRQVRGQRGCRHVHFPEEPLALLGLLGLALPEPARHVLIGVLVVPVLSLLEVVRPVVAIHLVESVLFRPCRLHLSRRACHLGSTRSNWVLS
mmetsp:Transcript_24898/g.83020  ORF Transcript_24898/g.83020 Transcript_24898/m.83020 type:complete len:358 (-) Transcript_24898:58-1131(-)